MEDINLLNTLVSSNNNNILIDIQEKIEKAINDLNNKDEISNIIKQLKNIIIIINENKKNF